ncbi:MAG: helix-turn-helix domain-containing protein [Gammaproteobacteria bacterium]|nr:helix-turn-helix domain-containing protein [Gammaproteobacteria bacterium]
MRFSQLTTTGILSVIGQRLKQARLDANLTQQALAEAVGVSLKTVRNAEDGQNISLETLVLLLQGLQRSDELESFLVSTGPSPIELAERHGKRRRRATGKRGADPNAPGGWEW